MSSSFGFGNKPKQFYYTENVNYTKRNQYGSLDQEIKSATRYRIENDSKKFVRSIRYQSLEKRQRATFGKNPQALHPFQEGNRDNFIYYKAQVNCSSLPKRLYLRYAVNEIQALPLDSLNLIYFSPKTTGRNRFAGIAFFSQKQAPAFMAYLGSDGETPIKSQARLEWFKLVPDSKYYLPYRIIIKAEFSGSFFRSQTVEYDILRQHISSQP